MVNTHWLLPTCIGVTIWGDNASAPITSVTTGSRKSGRGQSSYRHLRHTQTGRHRNGSHGDGNNNNSHTPQGDKGAANRTQMITVELTV